MDKRKLKDWESDVSNILIASQKFMKSCNKMFGRGYIGELLVFQQLIKSFERELILDQNKIIYHGSSKKDFDFELYLNGNIIQVNAKGTLVVDKDSNPKWVRQHALKFCNSVPKSGKTLITVNTEYRSNFFYIYVDVNAWLEKGKASFFVLSDKEAKNKFGRKYKKCYNNKKRRKNDSDDMWIEYSDISEYVDNNLNGLKKRLRKNN